MTAAELKKFVRDVPDFPKPGILFRDITPLLADADARGFAIDELAKCAPPDISAVAAVESRGFLFGVAVAQILRAPFVPVRKAGKLPRPTVSAEYQLEYGADSLHIHKDAVRRGERVFLVDDLIATGGTLAAAAKIIGQLGATVAAAACVIELRAPGGREKLGAIPFSSLLSYD